MFMYVNSQDSNLIESWCYFIGLNNVKSRFSFLLTMYWFNKVEDQKLMDMA